MMFRTSRLLLALLALVLVAPIVSADPIWIDVRTADEVAADSIPGDTHIPLADLDAERLATLYAKDAELLLYCRSGNRAGQAKAILEAAGFTNVVNAGSIDDVRALRDMAVGSAAGGTTATGVLSAAPR